MVFSFITSKPLPKSIKTILSIFPTERYVEDPENDLIEQANQTQKHSLESTSQVTDEKTRSDGLPTASSANASDSEFETITEIYEIRDESKRKWWSIFNEYEYRTPRIPQAEKDQTTWRDKILFFNWFDKNDTKEERILIIKLDILLCFYSFVMYWVKYLDQTNLNNAYVSGMKESLGMKGNDLVNTQAVYTVGSVVFQLPFMYLIHRYPTNYILPLMDLFWGIFTLVIYKSRHTGDLQAFRFFVGIFESCFYPTINYLIGSWYKPKEYARRAGIFYWGQMLGVLTAGLIQASALQHLMGVGGLEGWRWMFIIDAIITIPVGIIGIWALPGTPAHCYSKFLTDKEIVLARNRLRKIKINVKDDSQKFFTLDLWKKILSNWSFYVFVLMNVFGWNNTNATSGSYLLWLKSLGTYTPAKVNQLSAISPALGIVWIFAVCALADLSGSRFSAIVISQLLNMLGNILLAVWYIPNGAKWFAFMLQYFSWSFIAVEFGWMSDSMRHSPQQRAITTICMNLFGQASTAWTSVLVWKTIEAPRFLKGYTFAACCAFSICLTCIVALVLYKRDERRKATENGVLVYDTRRGESEPVLTSDSNGHFEYNGQKFKFVEKSVDIE